MNRKLRCACLRAPEARNAHSLLVALGLLMALAQPLVADVIDDFSNGRKFIMHGQVANPDWQIAEGQLKVNLPKIETYSAFYYLRNYVLRNVRPVEFRVDLLRLAPGDGYAGLCVGFPGAPFLPKGGDRGYVLYRQHHRFLLLKLWDDGDLQYFERAAPPMTEPETLSLILTREGTTMRIQARVARRDDAGDVLLLEEVKDRSPSPAPVSAVLINCGAISNPSAVAFDNVTCSTDVAPVRTAIRRQGGNGAVLDWSGISIPLEAASLAGPWSPCAAALSQDAQGCSAMVACAKGERFFRLTPGRYVEELFNDESGNWETASPVAGRGVRPGVSIYSGSCRIRGSGWGNEDFVMRYGLDVGVWYTDCVASVDIVDWDDTMVGAAFGIYLRVKPDQDLWFVATDGLPRDHYAGMLVFNEGTPARSVLTITGPGDNRLAAVVVPGLDPAKRYRLQFCAVGNQLTLALFDLDNLETPLATCQKVDSRIPMGLSALGGRRSRSGGEVYDVTIDRFLLNGVIP